MLQSSKARESETDRISWTGLLNKRLYKLEDTTRVFSKHEASDFHKQAVAAMANKADVGVMLSSQLAKEKQPNREYLLYVMSTIRFLARQALPLRGDGDEKDSNFYQLLVLCGESKPEIKAMMDGKKA